MTSRTAQPLPVGSLGGAKLVFSDEFTGTALDANRWRTCSWWAATTCSIEPNSELELYTPKNVSVANGMLKLQARQETAVGWNAKTYDYTSGMVSTGGLGSQVAPGFTYTYGYAETRVKVPAGRGLWPAFWMLPADHSWPPEIDAMEIQGQEPNVTHMTNIYLDASGNPKNPGSAWSGPDFSAGWHTLVSVGTNIYHIISVKSGKLLDVSGGSTADGTPMLQWPDNGATNQQWQIS